MCMAAMLHAWQYGIWTMVHDALGREAESTSAYLG